MASHPYISGAGNITQMITFLRKSFPATVNSDTVKKLGLAPNNESYVINALQFIGLIDEEGKRTERGHEVMATHDDQEFQKAFESLIRESYKDLFDLRGEDALTMTKDELIGYFRSADKTSDVIGGRQASVFQAFRAISGHENVAAPAKKGRTPKASSKMASSKATKQKKLSPTPEAGAASALQPGSTKGVGLTVRVEINLPAEASAETYDHIFKSIRANLLNE